MRNVNFNLAIFGCLCILLVTVQSAKQCMTVYGQVKCGSRAPETPVFIKLYDEDTGIVNKKINFKGGPDDWMDEGYASKSGYFQLHGCASDPFGTTIDPMLRIYHMCKGEGYRRTVVVPKESVKAGEYRFNATIDLNIDEERNVQHKYELPQCSSLQTSTGKP
ncbi:Transthyretin-like protein 46 [Trichinella pseudospiralis]|uniref:Transthyretin-like protein 46 n=1 Tax=Trichinella pseudospiralis TaxID=6337 RepID=A0A0V1G548_TRIPS|nr:Transthyretin-like protein 46 [Trichinella pseudospiralis]